MALYVLGDGHSVKILCDIMFVILVGVPSSQSKMSMSVPRKACNFVIISGSTSFSHSGNMANLTGSSSGKQFFFKSVASSGSDSKVFRNSYPTASLSSIVFTTASPSWMQTELSESLYIVFFVRFEKYIVHLQILIIIIVYFNNLSMFTLRNIKLHFI